MADHCVSEHRGTAVSTGHTLHLLLSAMVLMIAVKSDLLSLKIHIKVCSVRLSLLSAAGNPLVCSAARFHCRNGRCVDRSFLCNGQDNCQDNSDEENCLSTAGI